MNRRSFRKWALWLLPLLAARAFLPVGFMLSAGENGLFLAFCSGQASSLSASRGAAADHSSHFSPSDPAAHRTGEARADLPCPFALAMPGAPVFLSQLGEAVLRPADEPVPEYQLLPQSTGPYRADRIRGPPSLS